MPALYLLFSHYLTEEQEKEAEEALGINEIYYLPDNLQVLWSQIPPELPIVGDYIQPIKEWLKCRVQKGDYLLVQGDFGATYLLVKWAFSVDCIPIYATTQRKVRTETHESKEIIINRTFAHVRFRKYEKL